MLIELNNKIEMVVAAVIMLSIVLHFVRTRYSIASRSNNLFVRLTAIALLSSVMDIAATVTESYAVVYPQIFYRYAIVTRMLFNTCASTLIYQSFLYFNSFNEARKEKSGPERAMLIIAIMSIVGYVAEGILRWRLMPAEHYDFQSLLKAYIHPIYQGLPMVMLAIILAVVIYDRKHFNKKQMKFIIAFLILVIVGLASEIITSFYFEKTRLCSMFCVAMAIALSVYSLESPSYQRLEETLEKLQKSREEAEKARKRADEANAAKSEFLARMSHEIRTPINGVIGMDEMILLENTDPIIDDYALDIKNAAGGLISILDDILDFSVANSSTVTIKPEDYSLPGLLRNIYNIFSIKAKYAKLRLVINVDEHIPAVLRGDDLRIRQVITNLMNNAVKYTQEGKVTLSAELVGKTEKAAEIRIAVQDTGLGIREEDMDRLLFEFERLDLEENRNVEGTGLGLAIVSKILNQMGSELKVESTYGEGSEFSFIIRQEIVSGARPGENKGAAEALAGSSTESFIAPKVKLLVVDDNLVNLKVFSGVLKNSRMQIKEAQSGEECLKLCDSEKFDLIFMDHLMPKMDGVEAMKRLRQNADGLNSRTPIVCLTANAVRGAREEYLREGFDDAAFKPINPSQLYSIIRNFLPESLLTTKEEHSPS